LMLLEPEAERSCVLVGATAKTSLAFGCALSTVWRVRYCFDYSLLGWIAQLRWGTYHDDVEALKLFSCAIMLEDIVIWRKRKE
jgi:hypothetical protein